MTYTLSLFRLMVATQCLCRADRQTLAGLLYSTSLEILQLRQPVVGCVYWGDYSC